MNAYELADELETVHWQESDGSVASCRFQAQADMLRQQADRIAKLEHEISFKSWLQTKPLSNDEILEMTIWNKNLYELYVEMEKEDMIAFARAIEERHGIK